MMDWTAISYVVVAAAAGYVVWRVARALGKKSSGGGFGGKPGGDKK